MYLSLAIGDEGLAKHLAAFMEIGDPRSYTLADLALLYVVEDALDLGGQQLSTSVGQLRSRLDTDPIGVLRLIKRSIQNTTHRIVEIDASSTALLSAVNSNYDDQLRVAITSKAPKLGSSEHQIRQLTILSTDLIESIQSGIESAAVQRIADQISRQMFDSDSLDEWSDLPLPLILSVAQRLWQTSSDSQDARQRHAEIVSKLLRTSAAHVVRASLVFSIPGIGPAVSAALFANRLERAR